MRSFMRGGISNAVCCFTLIEMLVVIAIISILASLLMPTLKRASESGVSVSCANNLKQQGLYTHLYCSDYGGWGPAVQGIYMENSLSSFFQWYDLYSHLYIRKNSSPTKINIFSDSTSTYFRLPSPFGCPSSESLETNEDIESRNYGINKFNSMPEANNYYGYRQKRRLTMIRRPSLRIIFADIFKNSDNCSGTEFLMKRFEKEADFSYRHNLSCNLLMADSHLKVRPIAESSLPQNDYAIGSISTDY